MSHSAVKTKTQVTAGAAYAMLTVVMMLWASGVIVARFVHADMPPVAFSFSRWAVAVLVLTPLAARVAWQRREYLLSVKRYFFLLGLFMAGGSTLLVWSVQYTTATNAGLVSAAQPTVTAVMAWLVVRERLSGAQALGIVAAAIGVLVMVVRMDLRVLLDLDINPGDGLVLLAVMFYAAYSINLHRWLSGLSAMLMIYLTALGGLLMLVPAVMLEIALVGWPVFLPKVSAAIVYMAFVPTLLATTLWNISVGVVGPNRASVFINLLPIFAALMAVVLLGEQLHVYHVLGGGLVWLGVTMVVLSPRRDTFE